MEEARALLQAAKDRQERALRNAGKDAIHPSIHRSDSVGSSGSVAGRTSIHFMGVTYITYHDFKWCKCHINICKCII